MIQLSNSSGTHRSLFRTVRRAAIVIALLAGTLVLQQTPPVHAADNGVIGWPFSITNGDSWQIFNGYNTGPDHSGYELDSFDFQIANGSTAGKTVYSPVTGTAVPFGNAYPFDGTSGQCVSISIAGYDGYHLMVCHLDGFPTTSIPVTKGVTVLGTVNGNAAHGNHIHMTLYYLPPGVPDTVANASQRQPQPFSDPWMIGGCDYPSNGSADQHGNPPTPVPCTRTGSAAILQLPKSNGTDACQDQSLLANDDGSTGAVPLPFTANFFGNSYSAVFLNNNGNVTFNGPQYIYTPYPLLMTNTPIIAPFFGDVDTRGAGASPLTYSYGDGMYAGHPTLCVDWVNVGYYYAHTDKLNSFQLLLVDRSDTGPGNFDIMFNYNQIQWETGDASGGSGGLGGSCARVGYSNGTSASFELPGSAVCGSFLDSNPGGLIHHSLHSTQLGRYIFEVRNGVAPTGGTISGHVFAHSNDPANVLTGAFVQVCSATNCNNTLTDAGGNYTVSGLADGTYTVTAFPPGGSTLFQNSISNVVIASANTLTGQDIVLQGPAPLPNGTTITDRYVDSNGIPVIYWQDPLTLSTQGCTGGTASYQITLADGTVASSGGMAEGPAGTYTAHIAALYPNHGNAHVAITINCPSGSPTNTAFDIYIDPSGTVQTVGGAPIAGATVTLYRSDSSSGPFTPVPNGSGIMSIANQNNPDTTDANGHFGWDVIAGYYKIRASKTGCVSPTDPTQAFVESPVLTVPPAVTNLVLTLDCRAADSTPPTTTASATVGSTAYTFGAWTNQSVQVALNAADDSGGSGVAHTYYAVDSAACAPSNLGSCTTYSGSPFTVSGEGVHTVIYFSVDNAGNVETANTVTVKISSLTITTDATLPNGTVGVAYSTALQATGGTAPYTWTVSAGALPPGLTLDPSTGVISGTPTTAGTFGFTVQVTDSSGQTGTKQFALAPPPPSGTAGSSYSVPVSISPPSSSGGSGGTSSCGNYSIASGSLPAGLTLDPTTGLISGTPASGGTYSFTVQCTASGGQTATKDFTITIDNPAPAITSLSPSGAIAGGGGLTLVVNGSNFVQTSTVDWNGASRPATYVSATQLQAAITSADLATAGTASVTVANPNPGGGTSSPAIFTISADTTAPTCVLKGTTSQGNGGIIIAVQDSDGGLAATTGGSFSSAPSPSGGVQVTAVGNATVTIPSVSAGTTGEVDVTALKVTPGVSSHVSLQVTDVGNNVTACDPVVMDLSRTAGQPSTQTATGIDQSEHLVHIYNGAPGLSHLTITVNGQKMHERGLQPNQQYTIDIGAALQPGSNNTVTFTAHGTPRGEATFVIADS